MWMSFITSGVKIFDEPRMYFLVSAGARPASAAMPVAVRAAGSLRAETATVLAFLAFTGAERLTATAFRAATVLGFLLPCHLPDPHHSTSFFSLGSRLS